MPSPTTPTRTVDGPDGRYRVEAVADEVRAHMFAEHVRIVAGDTGEAVLDLWGSDLWRWDTHAQFVTAARVRLQMRRFAHMTGSRGQTVAGADRELVIVVDLEQRRFEIERGTLDDPDLAAALRRSLAPVPPATR